MRCRQCGVEPLSVVETTTINDPEPTFMPGYWPAGDHEHAVSPPSPEELKQAGDRAWQRVIGLL